MTKLVPPDQIERMVGARRHHRNHLGYANSEERVVYILHPETCVASGIDLRDCPWSLALDNGINENVWALYEDRTVVLLIGARKLVPYTPSWLDDYLL